jgi:Ca2+-binding RTX toxin-like protein
MATVYLKDYYSMASLPSAWIGGASNGGETDGVAPDFLEYGDSDDAIGLKGGVFTLDGALFEGRITEIVVTSGFLPFPHLRIVTDFNMQHGEYALVQSGNLYGFIGHILDGNDIIYGGLAGQRLDGFDGDDVLIGGPGGDTLRGGNGNNTASYATAKAGVLADLDIEANNEGDAEGDTYSDIDNLTGSRFGDLLLGDGNANRLAGGPGSDFMHGRGNNDALTGGAGGDEMFGGLGADDFIYASVADSRGSTASTRDLIRDFNRAEGDDIWLRAIDANTKAGGNQNFSFIGTKAFSGKAGELRYQKIGNNTHITGDTNGDKTADITIVSDTVIAFAMGDFVL